MKALPIGIQDFEKLRRADYLYVDKTEQYFHTFKEGTYFFLSRPRRFGKSMMLSTLKCLYLAKKELFSGLWIEDKWDWRLTFPVIRVDLSEINTRKGTLEAGLMIQMQEHAQIYNIKLESNNAATCFRQLIHELGSGSNKCVVLIDEYDKPITDYITEENISAQHVKELKSFYGVLKAADPYLHKVVISGVSKYGKVSIFSDLNNLNDLTISPDSNFLCGYSQKDLEYYFDSYMEKPMNAYGLTKVELLYWLKAWYNGYSWNGIEEETVYNPFSILNFFYHARFNNYWFETGTPTLLTKLLKKEKFKPENLEFLNSSENIFSSSDIFKPDVLSLLVQTGYLTVKKIILHPAQSRFLLGYPNQEVRLSFSTFLLAEYTEQTTSGLESEIILNLKDALTEKNWADFFIYTNMVFASVPYQIFNNNEAYYHSLVHVILTLTGHLVLSEVLTNKGRIDTVLETEDQVVIFEFKMDSSAAIALNQIHEKKYAARYGRAGKELVLIGVNFDSEARSIKEWKVEA